jgi:hypothetical protein
MEGDITDDLAVRESWARMVWAAVRVCVFIHDDDARGIGAMLEELRHTPPADWPLLAKGFEEQLVDHQGAKVGQGEPLAHPCNASSPFQRKAAA